MVKTLKTEPKSLLQKTPSLTDSVVKSDKDNNYHFWCVHYRPNTLADNTLFHHSSQKHGDRHIAAVSHKRGSCWVSDLAGVAEEWSWGGSWKARPLGSASSSPAWRAEVSSHPFGAVGGEGVRVVGEGGISGLCAHLQPHKSVQVLKRGQITVI